MQRWRFLFPLAEVVAMATLLVSYIWWWGDRVSEAFPLCFALYVAIGLLAHLRARETAADIGFRLDTLVPAGRIALAATLMIGVVAVGIGALWGSLHFPPLPLWPRALWYGMVWGLIQQYGLLAIFYRRFRELFGGSRGPRLAASAMFALFHLPNPFLMGVTFAAGVFSCWLYRRSPNLIVLGLMHGLVSLTINSSLPEFVTMGMRVGPAYFRYIPGR
jgi:membrane protease YdiL (CAAX protease family)